MTVNKTYKLCFFDERDKMFICHGCGVKEIICQEAGVYNSAFFRDGIRIPLISPLQEYLFHLVQKDTIMTVYNTTQYALLGVSGFLSPEICGSLVIYFISFAYYLPR